jgi:hypothetical protein
MEVNHSGSFYQFYWANEGAPTHGGNPKDLISDASFASPEQLTTFIRQIGQVPQFRELLRRGVGGVQFFKDDAAIVDSIVEAIQKKRLKIIKRTPSGGGGTQEKANSPERVVVPRKQATTDYSPEPDPPTFASNNDAEAQAAALVAAAEQGSAICEECEKRRQQQQ